MALLVNTSVVEIFVVNTLEAALLIMVLVVVRLATCVCKLDVFKVI